MIRRQSGAAPGVSLPFPLLLSLLQSGEFAFVAHNALLFARYILTKKNPLRYRIRNKQLQAAAKPDSDAGHHLETKAMSSAPKPNAARKRGPWGEDYLMTSTKSTLINAKLVVCPFF